MKEIWNRVTVGKAVLLIVLGAVLLVPLAGCSGQADAKATTDAEPIYVEVHMGDIEDIITATGDVAAEKTAALNFEMGGSVTEVAVEEGDEVQAGQVLARLDDGDLQDAVERAKISLRTAQINLERARKPASNAEILAAEASVSSAKASLARLYEGPTELERQRAKLDIDSAKASLAKLYEEPTELERQQAKLAVDSAKNQLWSTQANRDSVAGSKYSSSASKDSAEASVLSAEVAVQRAQVNQQMLDEPPRDADVAQAQAQVDQAQVRQQILDEPPTDSDVAQAQAQVDQAEANLKKLLEQPYAEDIAIQEAQVEQAQLNLTQAEEALSDALLAAPFEGIITSVNVEIGESASSSAPAITLVDDGQLQVDAQVDEMDIARVSEGQTVRLSFAALDNQVVNGEIANVAMAGTQTSAGVGYDVEIALSETDLPVRLGMTADVEIIVDQAEDAILVPNQAITEEREKGLCFVTKKTALGSQRVQVELGLRAETYSQVLSGVEEGDQVQLIVATQGSEKEQAGNGMPFMRGGK